MIDLRSDTVTRPTPAMREAIARAVVGDDALGDDPTVRELEARVAGVLGHEAALFFPSGIMANETAVLCLAPPGTEVVVEAGSHFFDWEDGAAAQWAGVQLRPLASAAIPGVADLEAAVRSAGPYQIRTSLVCLENTHNAAAGRVLPLDAYRTVREWTAGRGVPLHLDGARLWNAAIATGHAEADWAASADSVMVTLSKGLGCPVGSLLASSRALIDRAWRVRRRLGGAMRQTGILAAAGLFALEHHRERLADDHRRAADLARLCSSLPGLRVVAPETNIVMFDIVRPELDAGEVLRKLEARGVAMAPFTETRLRAVTHLDIDDAAVRAAAAALAAALAA